MPDPNQRWLDEMLTLGWRVDEHSSPSRLMIGTPDSVRVAQRREEEWRAACAVHDATERASFQRNLDAGVQPLINGYPISSVTPETPTQLDRIEALLQELVDHQRAETLQRELERLTRDWRPGCG